MGEAGPDSRGMLGARLRERQSELRAAVVTRVHAGVQGKTTKVLLHAYVEVPAPTAIVVRAQITRIHHGAYGLEITARIPRIAGGAGSVTKFRLDVGRKFTYRGQAHSFLTASCPTGRWGTRGEAEFSDGTRLHVLHLFPCATAP